MEQNATQGNKMMPFIIGGVLVVVALFGAVLLTRGNASSTSSNQVMGDETTTGTDSMTTGTELAPSESMGDIRTIEVEAGAFYYKPETITIKKGETVKIVLNSKDMMHDFNIDELNVKSPIVKSGETNTVEFTATTAGTFEYYCSVGQHRQQGQVGTITVTE